MGVTRLRLSEENAFTSGTKEFVVLRSPASGTVVLPAVCSHRGGPVNLGTFGAGTIVCPWHDTQIRCPAPRSFRSPFVFVRRGRELTLVGKPVERTYRLPVLAETAA